MLRHELLHALNPHFLEALIEDAATTCRLFRLIGLIFSLDDNFLLLKTDSNHFLESVLELFSIALVKVRRISDLRRLALLI